MTDELKLDKKPDQNREQRFLRAVLTGIFVMLALLDVFLFINGDKPDDVVVAVLLAPVLIATVLAYRGDTTMSMWVFAGSLWAAQIYLVVDNPQTPQEIDDLVGRYLFPVIFVLPLAFVVMKQKLQRNIIVIVTLLSAAGTAFLGFINDPDGAGTPDPTTVMVVNIAIFALAVWMVVYFVRNFTEYLRWYMNRPLRVKLIASMVIVVVLGSGAITIVQAVQSTARLRESTTTTLQNTANGEAEDLGDLVASRLEMMSSLGISSSVIEFVQEQNATYTDSSEVAILRDMERLDASWVTASDSSLQVREKLTNDLAKEAIELKELANGEFLEVFFTDKYGGLAGASDRTSDYYQADEDWWQAAFNNGYGGAYIGPMEYDESAGAYAINLAVPVYDRQTREVIGVMRTTFDITEQLLLMAEHGEELGESVEVEILFADGSHVHEGEYEALTAEEHDIAHGWNPENVTMFWDGNEKYAAVTRVASNLLPQIEELDWEILVTQDVAVANSEIQATVFTSIGIGLVVILSGGGLAAFLGQTISNPVLTLTRVAQSFAGGDYSARSEVTSEDEVGQLSAAFNQMAAEVGSQTLALAERAREMEASQRVTFAASERTTPEDFLNLLVNLIADQFDVYHCQVYLVDEEKNAAVLSQSTGYAGRQLLQRGHQIPLDAQSLVTQCINTGEAVLVAETTKDPNWLPNPLLPYTQSELVVPLKIEDKVIGVMDIQDRVPERFTSETVPVFESMTEHVAFLYQNNELLEEIEEAQKVQAQFVRQLETTSEVAGQLTTILDPTQLLDQAVTMLQSRFNFYHAHIYLADEAKKKLVVASGSGNVGVILKDRGHNIAVDAERSFVARAFRDAAPVRVSNTTLDPDWLPNPLLPDTRSEMAVPLITRGQVIGVLDIQDEVIGRFTEVDEDTMLTLAGQLATSVDTARLFIDVENAAERTKTLYQVSNQLNSARGLEEILKVVSALAIDNDAYSSTMMLVSTDENGEPEWAEIVASIDNSSANTASTVPVGTRFYLPEMPFTKIWIANQFECQFVSNVETDPNLDEASRAVTLQSGAKALTILPLSQGENWLGFITFNWSSPHEFSAVEKELFNAFVGLTSQAIAGHLLQEDILQREERFRALFNYSPDAVLVLDFENVKWLDANANATEMFGLSHDELLKIGPVELSPSHQPNGRESAEYAAELIGNAIQGGSTRFDWVHKDANGREFDCEIRLAILPGGGSDLLVNIQDITQRKAAQQAIVQGDRLKSEFLANMSHELRTPLNSILGYTDVLLMGLDGELDEEVTTDLEAIHDNSQHLLKLINDILDLAKIEAGRMTFELGDVNVTNLLTEVQKTSAGLLVGKEVEMVVEADEKLPTIVADYHRVYQVVNNLVSNAVKFTEKGSITLRAFAEGDEMVLQVADTGIGIAPDDLEAIFDEFTQADTSSTRQHEGTGLGLTITRRLVQMHGGTILVESEMGKGSTFSARFPMQARVNPELLIVAQSANGKN